MSTPTTALTTVDFKTGLVLSLIDITFSYNKRYVAYNFGYNRLIV